MEEGHEGRAGFCPRIDWDSGGDPRPFASLLCRNARGPRQRACKPGSVPRGDLLSEAQLTRDRKPDV